MLSRLQYFFPQRLLTSFAGFLANLKVVWIKNRLIQYFVWRYPIQLEEALQPNPYAYENFNAFFTRRLKPETRPIAAASTDLISPADGCVSQLGALHQHQILQAKGHYYHVQDLLGGDQALAEAFKGGSFATVYLAPKDYHRVHMPLDGRLLRMIYIPGKLFSVNFKTAACTPNLFARNERVVCLFQTAVGKVAVILVGAMIVGSIDTVWAGTVSTPNQKGITSWDYESANIGLKKGDELGHFKLGSTAIILFEPLKATFEPHLAPSKRVQMGEKIGTLTPDPL